MVYNCTVEKYDYDDLNKLHTKQLLKKLNAQRKWGCDEWCGCENIAICKEHHNYNVNLVKEILKTRPHILNKQESKQLRKEKIKNGK